MTAVTFSPDGTLLATGSWDGTAHLWNPTTGARVATLLGLAEDAWAVLLPDSSHKLGGTAGGSFQWKIKSVRFEAGELDPYDPTIRRLPNDAPLPLPAGWRPVTPRVTPPGPRPREPPSDTPRRPRFRSR